MNRTIGRWPTTEISDLCSAVVDCVNKTAPVVEGPTPYRMIRTTNVRSGRVDTQAVRYVDKPTYEEWSRRGELKAGDIVLTREAPLGEVGLLRDADGVFLGQRLFMYRANPHLADNRFLAYALQSPWVQAEIRSLGSGATVEHMRVPDCERISVPAPPLEFQRKVGDALGSHDDLIENNRRRIEILEAMARLVYGEWFVHFRFPGHEDVEFVDSNLGPIPEGWEWGSFSDLVDVSREAANPDEIAPGKPLVGLEHLPRRSTTLRDWDLTDDVGSRKSRFVAGDILFGKIRPYFHKVALAPIAGYCSTDAIIFRPGRSVRAQALAVASSDEFVAHAVQTSNGTKMPRANTDVLLQYPIPIAPDGVRHAFEAAVGPLHELCRILSAQMRVLAQARDLLLPRLISGELEMRDLELGLDSVA